MTNQAHRTDYYPYYAIRPRIVILIKTMLKEFERTIVVHRSDSIQSPAQKSRVTTTRKCLDLGYNVENLLPYRVSR